VAIGWEQAKWQMCKVSNPHRRGCIVALDRMQNSIVVEAAS